MFFRLLVFGGALLCVVQATAEYKTVAKKWAPQIWMAKNEKYRPSHVSFFLDDVKIRGNNGQPSELRSSNLPECTSDCRLDTKSSMSNPLKDNLNVFYGQDLKNAPVYAIIKQNIDGNAYEIDYWFFYPFNLGKKMCLGVYFEGLKCKKKILGVCIKYSWQKICYGAWHRFGNHVGDWETIKVTLETASKPKSISFKAHGKDYVYTYDGKDFVRSGKKLKFQGTHPVVYSAYGSHGARASEGTHVYKKLPNGYKLSDECSEGSKWETWKRIYYIKYKGDGDRSYTGWQNFLNFKGRWGNKKDGCGLFDLYDTISGQCELNPGPYGPLKKL